MNRGGPENFGRSRSGFDADRRHRALNIRQRPLPFPSQWAMTLARPSSISCHVTWRPMPSQAARIYSAILPSCPVGLGMLMTSLHMETRDFSSTWVRILSASLGLRPLVVLLAAFKIEAPVCAVSTESVSKLVCPQGL